MESKVDELKQVSTEINVIYMMSLAMDLILRDADWRMRKHKEAFRREAVKDIYCACVIGKADMRGKSRITYAVNVADVLIKELRHE